MEMGNRKFMVVIGEKAPNLKLGKWVQGMETNFDKEGDNVKLVEVFQVNCPGCFMYSMPEIINIYQKYKGDGLTVFGVATAFEDYDKNTLENLEMLLTTGEVVGDTKQALSQYGQLDDGKLQFKIPYPVAMDSLVKDTGDPSREKMTAFIKNQLPDFIKADFPLAGDFLSQYYTAIENQGSTLDILQNIDKYIKIDELTNLVDSTTLTSDVSFVDSTISVDSTSGFPESYGLIKIDSEIITI